VLRKRALTEISFPSQVFGNDGSKLDKGKGSFANAQLARASSIR